MTTTKGHRSKVYLLDLEGNWIDKGTGYAKCSQNLTFCLEDADLNLIDLPLHANDIYQRQQETLIVWQEPTNSDTYALSFESPDGCDAVWESIQAAQRSMFVQNEPDELSVINIPPPSIQNLAKIESALTEASKSVAGRDQLVSFIITQDYIKHLLPFLEMLEDLESIDDLYRLSSVIRLILFLNDGSIYDYVLQDDVFPIVVGILEYDRDFPSLKANFRHHIENKAKFKEIIPIENEEIKCKINSTYRLHFLKDVALARLLDDGAFSTMNLLTSLNQSEIVQYIHSDPNFLKQLLNILNSETESEDRKNDVIFFIQELCNVAKALTPTARNLLSSGQHGLFNIFEKTINNQDIKIRLASTSILYSMLDHDPSIIRSFCLAQKRAQQTVLFSLLLEQFLSEPDPGLRGQFAQIIKTLLDFSKKEFDGVLNQAHVVQDSDVDDFLNMFYEDYMTILMKPILSISVESLKDGPGIQPFDSDDSKILILDPHIVDLCNYLCEILCFTIKNHTYRSKYYILGSKITEKVCLLLNSKQTFLRLCMNHYSHVAAIRFFRACVGMKDEFYNRHLLKHDAFGPIIVALHETSGKYNLLNSACLEIFEFIRAENCKSIIQSLMDKYRKSLESITYVDTFKNLILRYEQGSEPTLKSEKENLASTLSTKSDGWGKVDTTEENYFNENDDDEIIGPSPKKSIQPEAIAPDEDQEFSRFKRARLVDYDDEAELTVRKKVAPQRPNVGKLFPNSIGRSLVIGHEDTESQERFEGIGNKRTR